MGYRRYNTRSGRWPTRNNANSLPRFSSCVRGHYGNIRNIKKLESALKDAREGVIEYESWKNTHGKKISNVLMRLSEIEKSKELIIRRYGKKPLFGMFGSIELPPHMQKRIKELEEEKVKLSSLPRSEPDFIGLGSSSERAVNEIERRLEIVRAKEAKKDDSINELKARAAANSDEQRRISIPIKDRLPANHLCPYCDNELGEDFEADHIHPVSKGGLSIISNMINVCYECNRAKGNKTLGVFADEKGFDLGEINNRLKRQRKDY